MKTILFFTFAVVLLQFIEVDAIAIATPSPAIVTPSPAIATPSPAIVTPSPAIATVRPAIATVRPAIATVRPAIATVRPAIATVRPDQQLLLSDQQLLLSDQQLLLSDQQLLLSDQQLLLSDQQLLLSDQQLLLSDQQLLLRDQQLLLPDQLKLLQVPQSTLLQVLVILVTIIRIYLRDDSELTQGRRRPKTVIKFLNKDLCAITSPDSGKTAVIIVHSARSHFERRTLIRQTYGTIYNVNNIRILAVVFMLGSSDGDLNTPTDTTKLQMEMDRYRDIIVGDFVDHYRNLTLKAIMAFEWLTTHCRQARFLIKTDDDVVINIYRLTKEMDSWTEEEVNSQNIWCPLHRNERTVDNKMSRFYASPVDFPNGIFPDHCGGLGWVTNIDVIDQFVDAISRWFLGRVCTHDDVFMTGILVRHINMMRNSSRGKIEPIKLVDRYVASIAALGAASAGLGVAIAGLTVAIAGLTVAIAGLGVAIAGLGVAIAGLGVAIAGLGVAIAGLGVAIAGLGVAIAGLGVTMVGLGVAMAGLGVAMAGLGVAMAGLGVAMAGR
ncbi:hypothetical protein HA402_009931 [Bradysia odoriphaga]|nr:hypothetical protein HA402_009931 [Bradysia odoriphaga]